MLTKVKVFSEHQDVATLPLNEAGRADTDVLQIRNVDGLEPVKAAINTSPLGSGDGVTYSGSDIPARNIVLTIHPNPNWNTWTVENLRELIYLYFMPKLTVQLIFYSDENPPVGVFGIVESNEANPFTKDLEFIVSIICPDPYFTAITPTVVSGISAIWDNAVAFHYGGSVDAGFRVKVSKKTGTNPDMITVRSGESSLIANKGAEDLLTDTDYFDVSTIQGRKHLWTVDTDALAHNRLQDMDDDSVWPILTPGSNKFQVITDQPGDQKWVLTFYERFGGL